MFAINSVATTWLGIFMYFEKNGVIMCSDCLVIICDTLTFEVMDLHKYFQKFTKFIWPNIAADLLFYKSAWKSKSTAILGPKNFIKFWKYFWRSTTSKVNGSLIMTKQSEHIITPFFSKYINTPSQVVATLAINVSLTLRSPARCQATKSTPSFIYEHWTTLNIASHMIVEYSRDVKLYMNDMTMRKWQLGKKCQMIDTDDE